MIKKISMRVGEEITLIDYMLKSTIFYNNNDSWLVGLNELCNFNIYSKQSDIKSQNLLKN